MHVVHTDHLNSPRALSNARIQGSQSSGTVAWRWSLVTDPSSGSNAFGNQPAMVDPDANGVGTFFSLRFPGQQYDANSGLDYNYFRDYEPGTGRYVESDPIGLKGGLASYNYADASPLILTDPMGWAPGDKWWEFTDRKSQQWYHKCIKRPGDPDASRDELAEYYAEWQQLGRPGGDNCHGNLPPPPPVPAPQCDDKCQKNTVNVALTIVLGFIVYEICGGPAFN